MSTQLEHLRKATQDVRNALASLSQGTSEFCAANSITCKPGCGACCEKPSAVWAMVGEMLPMAWDIFEHDQTNFVLNKISRESHESECVMYKPAMGQSGYGRCGDYSNRPITCILFGASIRKNKDGSQNILGCQYLRERQSIIDQKLTKDHTEAAALTEKSRSVILDHKLREEYPINIALKRALELIQWASYTAVFINAQHPSGQDCVR